MSEYRGYKYEKLSDGRWAVTFPQGAVLKAPKQTEESLKIAIDHFEDEKNVGAKTQDGVS